MGMSFTERSLANNLEVSPTAVSNSLKKLEKDNLITVDKDKESRRLSISLNKENSYVFNLKRAENLKLLYESGLPSFLAENLPGCTIIVFGSYSRGEDTINSDIDIAIIGSKEKDLETIKYSKLLERPISLNFYKDLKNVDKNLKENLCNGIVLQGAMSL